MLFTNGKLKVIIRDHYRRHKQQSLSNTSRVWGRDARPVLVMVEPSQNTAQK